MFKNFSQTLAIKCIRGYQHMRSALHVLVFSAFGVRFECKHTPTCSEYAIFCVKKYGTMRGLLKGIRRILRCY